MAHHTRLCDHAPGIRAQADRDCRTPAPAEAERLRSGPDRKLLPTCPALLAARMTCPTNVCGRLAPRLPWPMRPGLTRMSSSRIVMAQKSLVRLRDGAVEVDFVRAICRSDGKSSCADSKLPNPSNHQRPDRRPAFSLAIRGRLVPASSLAPSNSRQTSTTRGEMRLRSSGLRLRRSLHKKQGRAW